MGITVDVSTSLLSPSIGRVVRVWHSIHTQTDNQVDWKDLAARKESGLPVR